MGTHNPFGRGWHKATLERKLQADACAKIHTAGEVLERLFPALLKEIGQPVDRNEPTAEEYTKVYDRLLDAYRQTWERALILDGPTLTHRSRCRTNI